MKPNTAIGFLLAALALYRSSRRGKRDPLGLQWASSVLVAVLGVVSLAEYLLRWNAGIDQLLFRDPVQLTYPGRMAPITAVNLTLIGAMLLPIRSRAWEKVGDLLALLVCFGSTFAIVAYLYGVPMLYGSLVYTSMAVHTGFLFLVLSLGFLFIPKENGLGQIFRARTAGGVVARTLVPMAVLIPISVGGIIEWFNFRELRFGVALVVVVNVLLVVTSVWSLADALDKSEVGRETAELASETDALTGIRNRRYFDYRLKEEIRRCMRYSRRSCLILLDVDHFKAVNDRYGHLAGDEVLRTIAQACERNCRTTDVICRYGGEEFAIVAPETGAAEAMLLARKLREMVGGLRFEAVEGPVTISLGVAQIDEGIHSQEALISAADEALYAAKRLGRNREQLHTRRAPEMVGT